MKTTMFFFSLLFFVGLSAFGQTKKDGTPDMRYKANKDIYGTSYNTNHYSEPKKKDTQYNNGGQLYIQNGYLKDNGTYVEPHLKTKPDDQTWNNYNELYDTKPSKKSSDEYKVEDNDPYKY